MFLNQTNFKRSIWFISLIVLLATACVQTKRNSKSNGNDEGLGTVGIVTKKDNNDVPESATEMAEPTVIDVAMNDDVHGIKNEFLNDANAEEVETEKSDFNEGGIVNAVEVVEVKTNTTNAACFGASVVPTATITSGSTFHFHSDVWDVADKKFVPTPSFSIKEEDIAMDKWIDDDGEEMPTNGSTNAVGLAGQLTAGEVNDFKKWKMWDDIAQGELLHYTNTWRIYPQERYTALVLTESGAPVVDAVVKLWSKSDELIWQSKTDNTGKAELWGKWAVQSDTKSAKRIDIVYDTKKYSIDKPKVFERGMNVKKIPASCSIPDGVDICFTVDATGSMGDEIAYLQAELVDVINKIQSKHADVELNLGSVFYRDHGDTYLTRHIPFTSEISKVNQFIAEQYADGGGDGPEAVDDALVASLHEMMWHKEARARLMFVVLDAPPHQEEANLIALQKSMREAAAMGVRIIPLVASGGGYDVDKSLEYLMRCCALATNGTYAFLTNHSGVGGNHTAPSTDKYEVETLNALLLRVIDEYLLVPDCNLQQFLAQQQPQDTASAMTVIEPISNDSLYSLLDSTANNLSPLSSEIVVLKCYPNPATDYIWVQTSDDVKELWLADNSGKLMQKITPSSTLFEMNLTNYPSGVYYLKAWINDKWLSARIVVARMH